MSNGGQLSFYLGGLAHRLNLRLDGGEKLELNRMRESHIDVSDSQ